MRFQPLSGDELTTAATRSCVIRMSERMSETIPRAQWVDDGRHEYRYPFLFEWTWQGTSPPTRLSEDYTFCKRWQAIGGEIWVDPVIEFGHTGTFTYDGALINQMNREYHDYLLHCSPSERAKRMLAAGA